MGQATGEPRAEKVEATASVEEGRLWLKKGGSEADKPSGARRATTRRRTTTPLDNNLEKLEAIAQVDEGRFRLNKGGTEVDKSSEACCATTSRGTMIQSVQRRPIAETRKSKGESRKAGGEHLPSGL